MPPRWANSASDECELLHSWDQIFVASARRIGGSNVPAYQEGGVGRPAGGGRRQDPQHRREHHRECRQTGRRGGARNVGAVRQWSPPSFRLSEDEIAALLDKVAPQ